MGFHGSDHFPRPAAARHQFVGPDTPSRPSGCSTNSSTITRTLKATLTTYYTLTACTRSTIENCNLLGVGVKMITGDQASGIVMSSSGLP
eukprot:scaffold46261_cov55-Phaeocystis_antarctica.AAC.4